jgi:N-methylhydantoinase B
LSVDPVTYEIIRHRLWQILDEAAITLKRVSGSPITTEAQDFNVSIFRDNGDILSGGWGVFWHITSASASCRHVIREFGIDNIYQNDHFLVNDPYISAIHAPDIYVVSPVHHDGKLVAWAANFTHATDIGAIDPGGFCPSASDVFHEGLRIPGIKIIERGKVRDDVFKFILNMSREPKMLALDLRAQIAANNVVGERLNVLIQRYGLETIDRVMKQLIEYSERVLRSRLRELPDGTWLTTEYIDVENKIYEVKLALTKERDSLHFDFTGTSEQAPRALNCTYWGSFGGVMAAVYALLAYEIPWNEGVLKPVSLTIPQGTIVNCSYPAPVSISTVGTTAAVASGAALVISKMLGSSERYRKELMALANTCGAAIRHAGLNQEHKYYITGLLDWLAGSSGARSFADGVDTGGGLTGLLNMLYCPNVETLELTYPLLYLFRRQCRDSGGAGKYRGGVSGESAVTLHDAPEKRIRLVLAGWGVEPPASYGLFGGYPGCNAKFLILRNTDLDLYLKDGDVPVSLEKLKGKVLALPPQWAGELSTNDIFYLRWAGGGGYGDPLERDPKLVQQDVINGLVSPVSAKNIYGIVLSQELEVDRNATEELRAQIRAIRGR